MTVETITTTTSWVCPPNVTSISLAECWGAGGGGGYGASLGSGGAGGGGGAYAATANIPVIPGTTYTLTRGNAGTAGNSGANGGAGGATSALGVVAAGGAGGLSNNAGVAAGGTVAASTGTTRTAGGNSTGGTGLGPGGAGGAAASPNGGSGGVPVNSAAGGAGGAPGGGGAGGHSNNSNGGLGGAGQVRLTYFADPGPLFVNQSTTQTGVTQTMNVNMPAALVAGNIIGAIITYTGVIDTPAGWKKKVDANGMALFWKVSTGAETATTFSTSSTFQVSTAKTFQVSGAGTTDPFTLLTTAGGTGTNSPTVTLGAAYDNSLLLFIDAKTTTRNVSALTAGWTNVTGTTNFTHIFTRSPGVGATVGSPVATYTVSNTHAVALVALTKSLLGGVAVGSEKKNVVATSVIVGGVKKSPTTSVVVGGIKKLLS